jgi:ankyrin repeat protein
MKHILITTIAAVVLVGWGESQPTELPFAKAARISIHEAAEDGNIEAVKQHIAAGTDLNAKNEVARGVGETPLHKAAGEGRKKVAELLIANGADVDASSGGMTPLHKAATRGEKEIVELLITAGADVNAKINGVVTPLDWARIGRHTEISDLLRKHGGKSGAEYSIQYAITTGNIEAVKQHIAAGADVNAKTKRGDTPLDTAISRKHPEIVNLLRKHGGKTKVELKAEGK